MKKPLIPKPDPSRVKEVVEAMIDVTGKPIVIEEILALQTCPTCGGNDPFCPTCNGNDIVQIKNRFEVTGKVEWKASSKRIYKEAWQELAGDGLITIVNNDDLLSRLSNVKYVEADNNRCVLHDYYPGGLDNNRIYLVVLVDSRVDGSTRIG